MYKSIVIKTVFLLTLFIMLLFVAKEIYKSTCPTLVIPYIIGLLTIVVYFPYDQLFKNK
jgi:hypothetical protein